MNDVHVTPSLEIFTVFRFDLVAPVNGGQINRPVARGDYQHVEDAFSAARTLAYAEIQRLTALPVTAGVTGETASLPYILHDTEFGYDVKQGFRTLVRFWIHARPVR